MWYSQNYFKYALGILLFLLIVLVGYNVLPVITPVFSFLATFAFPVLIAGMLYYIFRPFVYFMSRKKIPRPISIIFLYLCIGVLLVLVSTYLAPKIIEQINALTVDSSAKMEVVKEKTLGFMNILTVNFVSFAEIKQIAISYLKELVNIFRQNAFGVFSGLTRITFMLLAIPFILFYFLKDDHILSSYLIKFFDLKHQNQVKEILNDMDNVLFLFITGQATVALILGSLVFIGYTLIGLDFALLLALFAMIFNFIPFVGAFISGVPALIIGFAQSNFLGIEVACVILLAHLVEANIVAPLIIGQRLNIHPLTIILLLIASGSLYGILGLFLATPIYALAKVVYAYIRKLYILSAS